MNIDNIKSLLEILVKDNIDLGVKHEIDNNFNLTTYGSRFKFVSNLFNQTKRISCLDVCRRIVNKISSAQGVNSELLKASLEGDIINAFRTGENIPLIKKLFSIYMDLDILKANVNFAHKYVQVPYRPSAFEPVTINLADGPFTIRPKDYMGSQDLIVPVQTQKRSQPVTEEYLMVDQEIVNDSPKPGKRTAVIKI